MLNNNIYTDEMFKVSTVNIFFTTLKHEKLFLEKINLNSVKFHLI